MAESIIIPDRADKGSVYTSLLPQIEALIKDESNLIANLANTASALTMAFDHLWTGFYIVESGELVLGPFQGPVACTRIAQGKGVCGTAWAKAQTIIVPDVHQFPGHIACSPESRSEIVVPGILAGEVLMVLDIDSRHPNAFDEIDKNHLKKLMDIIVRSA